MKNILFCLAGLAGLIGAGSVLAADPAALVEQRIAGDRSGVCLVASLIDGSLSHSAACADESTARSLDEHSRFEVGSISKALQGLLVAVLVERDELDLELPLTEVLGRSVNVPAFEDQPIRLVHLLTHTSGLPRLPPGFAPADLSNPYAGLTVEALLSALAASAPASAPGERFAYSNFGTMLLSLALVEITGQPLATLLQNRVFEPLGMADSGLTGRTVVGHDGNGQAVPNWDFDPDLGGVGAIRSTPADMARWLAALLEPDDSALDSGIASALARSREVLISTAEISIGYGWLHLPLNDRTVLAHDGGTGGFSSFAAVDPTTGKAAVVLMDTSMLMQNSLADLAYHLIDETYPLGPPQPRQSAASGEVLEDYVGRFALFQGDQPFMGDFTLTFSVRQGELLIQARVGDQVQPQIPLVSEGAGRFVQTELDLTIEFQREADGQVDRLDFSQGPLDLVGRRL